MAELRFLYHKTKLASCLIPYLISMETDTLWYLIPDTPDNRTKIKQDVPYIMASKSVWKFVGRWYGPNKSWTTDREEALQYLKKNLREQIARLVDLGARADAIEDMDEEAMKRTGVFGITTISP